MTARIAGDRPAKEGGSAPPAIRDVIAKRLRADAVITMPSSDITPVTQRSTRSGRASGKSALVGPSPISKSSVGPSKHWTTPRTVRSFAAQVNQVATMVLNGELDIETARAYGQLARTVAQSTSIEVTRARFLNERPDLSLDMEDDDD